jgi:hypothetical protein
MNSKLHAGEQNTMLFLGKGGDGGSASRGAKPDGTPS